MSGGTAAIRLFAGLKVVRAASGAAAQVVLFEVNGRNNLKMNPYEMTPFLA